MVYVRDFPSVVNFSFISVEIFNGFQMSETPPGKHSLFARVKITGTLEIGKDLPFHIVLRAPFQPPSTVEERKVDENWFYFHGRV